MQPVDPRMQRTSQHNINNHYNNVRNLNLQHQVNNPYELPKQSVS